MKGCTLPQSMILLKSLPNPDYLHDLQAHGALRASMSFLPGGCWQGAGLFDASPSYLTSQGGTSPGDPAPEGTSTDATARADSACPDPEDILGCLLWELWDAVGKVSPMVPLAFNAFLFVEVEPGAGDEYMAKVREVGGPSAGSAEYVTTERGREYLAAAHLIGCGSYNVVVEVLADNHERMLEVLHALTDLRTVRQYSVGRLRATDARGFGKGDVRTASA